MHAPPHDDPLDDPLEIDRYTRWQMAGSQRTAVSALQVSGMHCAACAGLIEQAVSRVDGVIAAQVNAAARRLSITWDPARTRPSVLVAAVRAAGYGAVPDTASSARELRRDEHRAAVWRLFVSGFCAMQVMMLATPSYVAGPGDLSPDIAALLNWGSWLLSLPVLAFASTPFFSSAWRSLRARRIGMDVPVALGIAVTFVASSGATFAPGGAFGHEVWFDSLTMFAAFLWLGRFLEMRMRHRAAEELEQALSSLPQTAWLVAADGRVTEVSVLRLKPGDVVRVPAGAALPADGTLLSGRAVVAEALLTGEPHGVPKTTGDSLLAGSLNGEQAFEMRVDRAGPDTRHEGIVRLMREALTTRPSTVRLADRWAGPFLWAVLGVSIGCAAVWSVLDPARALPAAVAVLIVTCPCALSLATPATWVAAARGLALRGVLLRRLEALEAMASITDVCIDKTGTLTRSALEVREVVGLQEGSSPDEAATWAASLARWSRHPVSVAVAAWAPQDAEPTRWTDVQEVPGAGLQATDAQGRRWRLGQPGWAAAGSAADDTTHRPSLATGGTAADAVARVVLSRDGFAVAAFLLDEALREDAIEAVTALRSQGLGVTLLSGDRPERAQALGDRVGIAAALGGASPEGKVDVVRQMQQSGQRVAMVGDGLNDAPVMAAAHVSVAMGHAALAAREGCDAIVLSEHLSAVPALRASALRTVAIVRQNLIWAALYNAACIPMAAMGWLPPWAAGLGMALSSLAVVLNAQRAAQTPATAHAPT